VVNRCKPRMQTPVMSRYPAPAPIDDFVLLFLPPCGLHLTPLATGSLESGLLVSPLLGGPARHRPFALTLHLHQCKSSRNLHPQYSAKSQSTPCCQSLMTARSDHPPVLVRSGPYMYHRLSTICNPFVNNTVESQMALSILLKSHHCEQKGVQYRTEQECVDHSHQF
jgi:hypothetical protein